MECPDVCMGMKRCDSDRNSSAGRAQIEYARRLDPGYLFKRDFHEQFSLRPRNQYIRRDLEFQPEKLTRSHKLRDRFASRASLCQRFETHDAFLSQFLVIARDQFGPAPAEHMLEQNPRLERGQRRRAQYPG